MPIAVKVAHSFLAVWPSTGYLPSLSFYFLIYNLILVIEPPHFIIVKNQ